MNEMAQEEPQLSEFLFGPLSTKEGRLRRARLARAGFYHDSTLDPPDPRPHEPITVSVRVGADVAVEHAKLFYTTDGTRPLDLQGSTTTSLSMQRTAIEWDTLQWCYLETWSAEIPGQPDGTHVQYLIQGRSPGGDIFYSPTFDLSGPLFAGNLDDFDTRFLEHLNRLEHPQIYGFHVDQEGVPAWLREAIIYQIFVDRFAPDPGAAFATPADLGGFYGGTLKGITSRLDYLSNLGITCLWLTPIFPSPSHHGYDPTDYGSVEPRLGTDEDFQTLLDEAHQRGIRVLLDFVANHCSSEHPAFVAAREDRTSATFDWYRFTHWPDEYDCFYDVPSQPRFNTDHAGVRAYLIEHARHWLERGVDGFRLDHAHGATHAFWSVFRAETRAAKPDSVTLGEITETPSFVHSFTGRMDGCLDFGLLEAQRAFFALGTLSVGEFDKYLRQHFAFFGTNLVLPSFLDNHDMNRFLWRVAGDQRRLRLAALCQFTLPGPPILYYGTEVGLSQLEPVGRLEEARLPMPWGNDQDASLLAFYRDLIAFRRQTPGVWSLPRQVLLINNDWGFYAYACGPYTVVLNNGLHETTVSLHNGRGVELALSTDPAVSLTTPGAELYLPPYAGAVCRKRSG
jgi:cyclomaltodextrinase